MVALVLALAACATSEQRPTVEHIDEASRAWAEPGRLVFDSGRDGWRLEARWAIPAPHDDLSYSAAQVGLHQDASELPSHRVHVASVREWRELTRQILEHIVPDQPQQGAILSVGSVDLVVFRDAAGQATARRLEAIPPGVEVVGRLAEERLLDVSIAIVRGLDHPNHTLWLTGAPVLPAIYVDAARNEVVLLSAQPEPELNPGISAVQLSLASLQSVVFHSHVWSLFNNPITTVSRLVAYAGVTTLAFVHTTDVDPGTPPPVTDGPPMDVHEWEQRLDALTDSPRYAARIEYLIGGDAFFTDLFREFNRARRSIDIQVFIFDSDDFAVRVADHLKQLSRHLRIHVLMDDFGSLIAGRLAPDTPPPADFVPPDSISRYLEKDSRINARRTSNPWFTADHTKRIIVDERIAYIGGMNIGREYRSEWHDMMVRIEGPLARRMYADFRLAWAHAGPAGDLAYGWRKLAKPPPPDAPGSDWKRVRPIYTTTAEPEIFNVLMEAFARAQQRIYIENAYIADDAILAALIDARHRGVDVRIILPTRADSGILHASNAVTANALLDNDIAVYLYPGMTHIKAAMVDGWATLGSANFDKLSLFVNQEVNIAFSDPELVAELESELFEKDFAVSERLVEKIDVGWAHYLQEFLANQL